MMRTHRKLALASALAAGFALASCGGKDFNDPTSQVPASASRSVSGFIDYLQDLVVSSADFLEPVDVSEVVPPTDDTGDPTPLT